MGLAPHSPIYGTRHVIGSLREALFHVKPASRRTLAGDLFHVKQGFHRGATPYDWLIPLAPVSRETEPTCPLADACFA
jgi:hypothetical protein